MTDTGTHQPSYPPADDPHWNRLDVGATERADAARWRDATAPAEDETATTREARAARRHRTNVVFHVVEVILLLACLIILAYFTVKYTQFVRGLQDFGDSFNLDPSPTADPCFIPDDPTCVTPGG